jgi:hypothetical protein
MTYKNLDTSTSFQALKNLEASDLKQILHPERIKSYQVNASEKLVYNYAAMPVDENHLSVLNS